MKKMALWLVVFCIFLSCGSAYADSYQSIGDIRETTPERWTEEYETKWRTVKIDVSVDVPQVDTFPIIRVKRKEAVDSDLLSSFPVVTNQTGYLVLYSDRELYDFNPPMDSAQKIMGTFINGELPTIQPEENDMPYEQALQLCYEQFQTLENMTSNQIVLTKVTALSGFYKTKIKDGKKEFLEHLYWQGTWEFDFTQLFAGISLEPAVVSYKNILMGKENNFVNAYGWLSVTDMNRYALGACFYDEIDRPYDDVPICSFLDAKAAIEQEIMAGHLRTIDECKLCYIPYYDKKDKDLMWLIPAWVVSGGYTRNSKKEFSAHYDGDGLYVDDGMEHYTVVYQANIGELIDYNDNSRTRRQVPKIITWKDIK